MGFWKEAFGKNPGRQEINSSIQTLPTEEQRSRLNRVPVLSRMRRGEKLGSPVNSLTLENMTQEVSVTPVKREIPRMPNYVAGETPLYEVGAYLKKLHLLDATPPLSEYRKKFIDNLAEREEKAS